MATSTAAPVGASTTNTTDPTMTKTEQLKSQAQEKLADARDMATDAYSSTRKAVKANPKTAGAIVVGAVAAFAGALFGANKLMAKNKKPQQAKK